MNNCIYRIYFTGEDKSYIGSAIDSDARLSTHIKELIDNTHSNRVLQLAFNKHGITNMKWEILEKNISSKSLLKKEHEYILKYDGYNGYNQTVATSAINSEVKLFVPDEEGEYDYSYINEFLSTHEVEFKQINVGIFKTDEGKKYTFSKKWWKNITQKDEDVIKILKNINSYIRNSIEINCSLMNIACCCEGREINIWLETNRYKNKYSELICKRVKKFYTADKHTITDIVVIDALNPFFLEKLKTENKEKYSVMKLCRLLSFIPNLSDKITIHLPPYLYERYMRVLDKMGVK